MDITNVKYILPKYIKSSFSALREINFYTKNSKMLVGQPVKSSLNDGY